MTTTPGVNPYISSDRRRRTVDMGLARELLAVALIIIGIVGLLTASFMWDLRAGIAACSVVLIAAGALLGLDR